MRVTLNCAMSADGKIALSGGARLRLSSPQDKKRVHELRARVDAILVGAGTVLRDDPELLVDEELVPRPHHPLRVVLDSNLRTPPSARVLRGPAKTLVFCAKGRARPLAGAEVVEAGSERVELPLVLAELAARGVGWLLVEGGGRVLASFLRQRLADEFLVYVAPTVVGGGAPTPADGEGALSPEDVVRLELHETIRLGEGILLKHRVLR
ncbi:MAG TPA: 2,5-diamino-6-(ribosylamino)-4(3H)-pyrimidinone 5'-phosphate reductase [Candidatus Thermoplasmatota archaeon]|nr:2,5-diamino-6-(ribosylamino)-4(3H)-pyrimidinone 5'-phosphate reductase [Candidatus Thermoplasmatota archaeon]